MKRILLVSFLAASTVLGQYTPRETGVTPVGSANTPLFDNGSNGFTNGTTTGNTTVVATSTGTLTNNHCVKIDASGNLIDSGAVCGPAPAGSANTPLFDNGSSGFTNGARSGNTTKVVTTTGSTPTNDCAKWDASGNLIDSGGTCGGSGSVATDSIFTAKGDWPLGTGSSTSAKLAVGANNTMPVADSSQTTGVKWSATIPPAMFTNTYDATSGTAPNFPPYVPFVAYLSGYNLKSTGTTTIFTVPSTNGVGRYVLTNAFIVCTAVTGGANQAIIFKIQDGSSNVLTTVVTGSTSTPIVGEVWYQSPLTGGPSFAPASGTTVQINVTQGSNSTTATGTVYLTGFYTP